MRLVVCLVLVASLGCAPPISGRTEQFELTSERVGDTFRLFVRLPADYDADEALHFPLVVQLDANLPVLEEFDVTAGAATKLESEARIAPVIVVGIGYPKASDAQRLRARDFALPMHDETFRANWERAAPNPAAPSFYAFLRDELLPELSRRYRLNGPSRTALFGHSMGGLFTVYAATRHDEAPLFSTYVAASPSLFWDDARLITTFDALPDFATPLRLLVTDGSLEGPEMTGFVMGFAQRVEQRARMNLTFSRAQYEAGHLGTTTPSFREGLLVFGGARP